MAQQGTYTAYQQLRPLEGDLGKIARDAADREQAKRDRIKEEQQALQDQQAKIAQNFAKDYDTLSEVITQNKSIDEAFARGVSSARDMMGNIYKDIQKNPSLANDVNTQLKLQNLRNFSKNLKTVSDRYTSYATEIAQGIQDGTVSAWEDNSLNRMDSVFRKVNLEVSPDMSTGMPMAATIKVDGNGDPVMGPDGRPVIEDLNLIEVLDGRGLADITGVYNMAGEAQKIGPDLGKRVIKKPDGSFSHVEYQSFNEIEGDVRNLVRGFIGDERNPTAVAKSIWSDVLGEEAKTLTAADMKRIEDTYTFTTRAFYDETAKKGTDFSARNAALERQRKAAEGKDEEIEGTGIEIRTDEQGNPLSADEVEAFVGEAGGGSAFSLAAPVPVGVKGNQIFVDSLFLTRGGQIVYSADVKEGKSGEFLYTTPEGEEVEISKEVYSEMKDGGLNVSQLNDIARAVGLRNAGELREELEKKRDSYKGGKSKGKDPKKMTAAEKIEFYKNKK